MENSPETTDETSMREPYEAPRLLDDVALEMATLNCADMGGKADAGCGGLLNS